MQLTIVREDNVVVVDGEVLIIPCDSLPANLHAVQWLDTAGEEEWTDADNTVLETMTAYQGIVDAWQAQKDFNDARELDPFHGMEGEELFDAQNLADDDAARYTFVTDSTAPVTSGLYTYNGGNNSAIWIKNAVDTAVALSQANVTITDIDNVRRDLTIAVANTVVVDITVAYQTAFLIKQDSLVEIAERVYTP
jgi:hypothetical protein